MNLTVKQVSSLEKIRPGTIENVREFSRKTVMRGQFFSYQIAVSSPNSTQITLEIDSALKNHITVYHVKNVIMDLAAFEGSDDDYLEKKPAVMPDLLLRPDQGRGQPAHRHALLPQQNIGLADVQAQCERLFALGI